MNHQEQTNINDKHPNESKTRTQSYILVFPVFEAQLMFSLRNLEQAYTAFFSAVKMKIFS